jgi:hypothetical protein
MILASCTRTDFVAPLKKGLRPPNRLIPIGRVSKEEEKAPIKNSGAARRWLATAMDFQPEAREVRFEEVWILRPSGRSSAL